LKFIQSTSRKLAFLSCCVLCLAGQAAHAQTVSFSPSNLSFGTPAASTPSAPQIETISVTGSGTVQLGTLDISGPDLGDFSATTNCPTANNGQVTAPFSCTVNVTFETSASGLQTASLSFSNQSFSVPLTGAIGAIKLFNPVNVSPSVNGAGVESPYQFGATSLHLSCPSGFSATLSSSPDGVGNVLTDNDIFLELNENQSSITDLCPSGGSCFNSAYSTPADQGELNGQDPDNFANSGNSVLAGGAAGGVPPINIATTLSAGLSGGAVQASFLLEDFGGVFSSSTLFLVTNCTSAGVDPGGAVSGDPVSSTNLPSLVQTFTFNSIGGQGIQFDFNFSNAAGQVTFPSVNQGPKVTDIAVNPTTFPELVAGTSAGPATCLIVTGEYPANTLCKAFLLQCPDANGNYAGTNCPQSTLRNLLFEVRFDTPQVPNPVPAGFTFAPGTGPGLLMGTDTWATAAPGSCTFPSNSGALYQQLCPQDALTAFYGADDARPSGPIDENSTFIPVINMPLPSTVATVTSANQYNWISSTNSNNVAVSFIASPATYTPSPSLPANGFTPAPIQSETYGVSSAGSPVPDPTFPVPGDTTLSNSGTCPTATPGPFTTSSSFTESTQGIYNLHYFATDCATTEELVFTANNDPSVNWASFKTIQFGVDTTPPTVSCGAGTPAPGPSANGWVNSNVTVDCTAQDLISGFLPVTAGTIQGASSFPFALTTNIPVGSASATAPATTTETIDDLAGIAAPIPTPTFKVDLAPPTISGPSLAPSSATNTYTVGQTVTMNFSCADVGSGVATCSGVYTSGSDTGPLSNGSDIDTSSAAVGSHTFTVSATDLAGNVSTTQSITYQVVLGNTVSFISTDKTTQGSWMGVYGADGYDVANGPQYPAGGTLSYGSYAVTGENEWTWAPTTTDPRGLEIDSVGDRTAAAWYQGSSFSIDVDLTDGQPHQVSLYLLDWDNQGRSETITIKDFTSGATLDTRIIPGSNTNTVASNFEGGSYLVWNITGHVTVTIAANAPPNCVVSGIFFGGKSVVAAAPTAVYSGSDTSTQGNWLGVYGVDGYWVANGGESLPTYDPTLTITGENSYVWAQTSSDPRAPETGTDGTSSRTAATWYSGTSFSFDVNIITGTHQVALYLLDWDSQGRNETVQVLNASNGTVLDTRVIPDSSGGSSTNTTSANFVGGTYLVWSITGHVTITVTRNGGPNGVVSAIFFGGAGAVGPPPPPPPTAAATWVGPDTTTQGAWLSPSKYGTQGYSLANSIQSFSISTLAITGQSNWTWAVDPSPPDPRDLQTDTHGDTLAAAWYSASSFSMDLNLTDGDAHNVELYVMDWDDRGRNETIQIKDANSGTVLSTRTIPDNSGANTTATTASNFVNGTYLTWTITGHVTIIVTANVGPNAVASGLFIDPPPSP
jgi:hypothetical protein